VREPQGTSRAKIGAVQNAFRSKDLNVGAVVYNRRLVRSYRVQLSKTFLMIELHGLLPHRRMRGVSAHEARLNTLSAAFSWRFSKLSFVMFSRSGASHRQQSSPLSATRTTVCEAVICSDANQQPCESTGTLRIHWVLVGVRVLQTPFRSPQANARCERLVGTIRRECLDLLIPLGQPHLKRLLNRWVLHYNHGRVHMSGTGIPAPLAPSQPYSEHHRAGHRVRRKAVLGGLHHEYWWKRSLHGTNVVIAHHNRPQQRFL